MFLWDFFLPFCLLKEGQLIDLNLRLGLVIKAHLQPSYRSQTMTTDAKLSREKNALTLISLFGIALWQQFFHRFINRTPQLLVLLLGRIRISFISCILIEIIWSSLEVWCTKGNTRMFKLHSESIYWVCDAFWIFTSMIWIHLLPLMKEASFMSTSWSI